MLLLTPSLEERLLSPRTLHFGKRQVFWQCLTVSACESMPSGIAASIKDTGRYEQQWRQLLKINRGDRDLTLDEQIDLQDRWRGIVASYTSCNLTKGFDKLPALAVIAKVMSEAQSERYIAGLWENGLAEQMAWRVVGCMTAAGRPAKRQGTGADAYRAPSWAWASVDGVIRLPPRVTRKTDYTLRFVGEPKAAPKERNAPFGQLQPGSMLRVQGHVYLLTFAATDLKKREWRWQTELCNGQHPWVVLYPDEPPITKGLLVEDVPSWALPEAKLDAADSKLDTMTCLVLMLSYTKDIGTSGYSGNALALLDATSYVHHAGCSAVPLSRIGLVELRSLARDNWARLEQARVTTPTVDWSEDFDTDLGHKISLV